MQALVIWMFLATVTMAPAMAETAVGATCGVDRYEPNDARSRAKSTRGKRAEGRVCARDADWFYVNLKAGATVDVLVEHQKEAPVEVQFYPPRSRKPQGKVTTGEGTVGVRFRATESAKHRVRIRSASTAPATYSLEFKTTR